MGGGNLTAIVQDLINGVAVVVLNRKTEELDLGSRLIEVVPGTTAHHVSRMVATGTSHTTENSAQICDGRYASTYQLAHCSHQPTSPELNPPEFPVQRQEPCRNEGNFETFSFGRAGGSITRATSPSFRLTKTPWRHRGCGSSPERDDAFACSLRRYPSTTSYPSVELFHRFLKRQSKMLDKALLHQKSLRSLNNSKNSNICIKKSSKTVNLNRRKKEQTAAEYWSRKFVTMPMYVKQKGLKCSGCRSPRPSCSRHIRPQEPIKHSHSCLPQPPAPETASGDRKPVMDPIRESLQPASGQMGGSLASYIVCPRVLERLEKHRRDFHKSDSINASTGSSPKSLHRLKVQKSSDSYASGILGRIWLGRNRSKSKFDKEKILCECKETMKERRKKLRTENKCECHKVPSSERNSTICECHLGKSSVPVKEPPPTSDCDCVIEDWLSELPIQASEKPKDKATRDTILKDLFNTLAAMDDDKFNKDGLKEIKKNVRGMPIWLPKDKDSKEALIDEISNNMFNRFKAFRDEKPRSSSGRLLDELSEELANEILTVPKKGNRPVGVMTDEFKNMHEQLILDELNEVSEFDNVGENKKKMAAKNVTHNLSELLVQNSDDENVKKRDSVMRFFIVRNWLASLFRENSINLPLEKQRQLINNIVEGSKAVQAKFSRQSPDSIGSLSADRSSKQQFSDKRHRDQDPRKKKSDGKELDSVIDEWLRELPTQRANENPQDKATRGNIKKSLIKTLATMDDDKFNKEGLNEIKKHVRRMPMWLPKDKDTKETFIDGISNNLFDRTKAFRNEKNKSAKGSQLHELSDEFANELLISPKENNQPVGVMSNKLTNIHEKLVLDALNEVSEFDKMSENKKIIAAKDVIQRLSDALVENSDDAKIEKIYSVLRFYIVQNWLDQLLRENSINLAPEKQRQLMAHIVQGTKAVQAKFSGQSPDSRRGSQLDTSSINRPYAATEHSTGRLADGRRTGQNLRKPPFVGKSGQPGQHKSHDCLHINKEPGKRNIKSPMKFGTPNGSQFYHRTRPDQDMTIYARQDPTPKQHAHQDPRQHSRQHTTEMRPGHLDPSKHSYYEDTGPYTSETQSSYKDPKLYAGNRIPNQYPSETRIGTQDPSQHSPEMRPGAQDPSHYSTEMRPGIQEQRAYSPEIRPGDLHPNQYPSEIRPGTQEPSHSPEMRPGTQEMRQYPPKIRPGNLETNQYPSEIRPEYLDPNYYPSEIKPHQVSSQYSPEMRSGTKEQRQYTPEMRSDTQEQRQYTPEMRPGYLDPNQYPSEIRPDNLDPNKYPSEIRTGFQNRDTPEIRPGNLDPSKHFDYQDAGPFTSETQSSFKDPKLYAGNRNPNQYPSEIKSGTQDPGQYSSEMRPGAQDPSHYAPEIRPGNLHANQYPSEMRPGTQDPSHSPGIRPGTQEQKQYSPEIRPGNHHPNQYPSEIRPGTQEPSQYSPEMRPGTQKKRQNSLEIRPGNLGPNQNTFGKSSDNLGPNQYPSKTRPGIQEKDTPELRPRNLDSRQYPDKTPGDPGPRQHYPVKRPAYSDLGQHFSNSPSSLLDPRQHSPAIKFGYQDPKHYPGMHYPSDKRPSSQYPGHGGRAGSLDRQTSDMKPTSPGHKRTSTSSNKEPSSTNEQYRDKNVMPNLAHGTDKENIPKESEFETALDNIMKKEDSTEASILLELLTLLEQVDNAGIKYGDLHNKLIKHINELSEFLTNNQSYQSYQPDATPEKTNMSKTLERHSIDEDPSRNRSKNIAGPNSPSRVLEKVNVTAGPSQSQRLVQGSRTPSRSPGRSLDDQRRGVSSGPDARRTSSRGRVEEQVGTTSLRERARSPKKALDESILNSNLNVRKISPSSTTPTMRRKSSGREPGMPENTADNIASKAKSKNEKVYFKELQIIIQKWIDELGIDLKGYERNLAIVIANEVLDRQKYLHLNPSVSTSDREELEDMKYQIFKMLKNKVDPGTIKVIMPHVDKLMEILKDVPVPNLSQPADIVSSGDSQYASDTSDNHPELSDVRTDTQSPGEPSEMRQSYQDRKQYPEIKPGDLDSNQYSSEMRIDTRDSRQYSSKQRPGSIDPSQYTSKIRPDTQEDRPFSTKTRSDDLDASQNSPEIKLGRQDPKQYSEISSSNQDPTQFSSQIRHGSLDLSRYPPKIRTSDQDPSQYSPEIKIGSQDRRQASSIKRSENLDPSQYPAEMRPGDRDPSQYLPEIIPGNLDTSKFSTEKRISSQDSRKMSSRKRSRNLGQSQYPPEKRPDSVGPSRYPTEIRTGDTDPTQYPPEMKNSAQDPRQYFSKKISDKLHPGEYNSEMRTGDQDPNRYSPEIKIGSLVRRQYSPYKISGIFNPSHYPPEKRPGSLDPSRYSPEIRPSSSDPRRYPPEIRTDDQDPSQYPSEMRIGTRDPQYSSKKISGNLNPILYPPEMRPEDRRRYSSQKKSVIQQPPEIRIDTQDPRQYSSKKISGNLDSGEYTSEMRPGDQDFSQYPPEMIIDTQDPRKYSSKKISGNLDSGEYTPEMRPGDQVPSQYVPEMRIGTQDSRQYSSKKISGNLDPGEYTSEMRPGDQVPSQYVPEMRIGTQDPRQYSSKKISGNLDPGEYTSEMRPGDQGPSHYLPEMRIGSQDPRKYSSKKISGNLDPGEYTPEMRPGDQGPSHYLPEMRIGSQDPRQYSSKKISGNLDSGEYTSEMRPGDQGPSHYLPEMRISSQDPRKYSSKKISSNLDPGEYTPEMRPGDQVPSQYLPEMRIGTQDPRQYSSKKISDNLDSGEYTSKKRSGDQGPSQYLPEMRIGTQDPRQYSSKKISGNLDPSQYNEMETGNLDPKQYSSEIRPENQDPRLYSTHMRPADQESRKYVPEMRLDNTSEIKPGDRDPRQATGIINASNRRPTSQYPEHPSVGPDSTGGLSGRQQHSDPSSSVGPNSIQVSENYPNNTTFTEHQDSDDIVLKIYGESMTQELHKPERSISLSKLTDDLANVSAKRYNYAANTNDKEINPVESEYLNALNHILRKDRHKDSIIPDLIKLLIRVKASDLSLHKFINKLISHIKELNEDLANEQKTDFLHGGRPLATSIPLKGARYRNNIDTDETEDPSREADDGNLIGDANRPVISLGKSLHERTGLKSRGRVLTPNIINLDSRTLGPCEKKSMYPRFVARKGNISLRKRPRSPSYNADTLSNGADNKRIKKEPANNANNAKSKNEQSCCTQLENKLHDWINDLGVDLKGNKKKCINELALDIADTQKYLQLNRHVTISNGEGLEYLKQQMFNTLNGKVDPDTLKTMMSHVDKLMERVKEVSFSRLAQPEERNDITAAHVSDSIDTILGKWCQCLPLPHTTIAEAKAIRRDIYNKIKAQIDGHTMDPDTGNKSLYEQVILDYIDELLTMLPIDPDDADSNQLNLFDKENDFSRGKSYKQQLQDSITHVSPQKNNPTEDEQASFELFKDDLADAFINLHYVGGDEDLKNKFKDKIRDKINQFANDYMKSDPTKPVCTAKLENDLYDALKSVAIPNDESMRSEAELARVKDLVHEWANHLPLKELTPREKVEMNKVLSRLAERVYELEKEKENCDCIYEDSIRREIEKCLYELPLRNLCNFNSMIDKLWDELKHWEHSKTSNEGSRHLLDGHKHGIQPSHLNREGKEQSRRILNREEREHSQIILTREEKEHSQRILTREEKEHLQRIKDRTHVSKKPIDLSSRPAWIPPYMKSTVHRPPIHRESQTDVADGKSSYGQYYKHHDKIPQTRLGERWQCPPPVSPRCHSPRDSRRCMQDYHFKDWPPPLNTPKDRSSLPALSSSYLIRKNRYSPPCMTPDSSPRTTSPCMRRRGLVAQDEPCKYFSTPKPLIMSRHGRLNMCPRNNHLLNQSSIAYRPHIYRNSEDVSSPYLSKDEQDGNLMKPCHSMCAHGSKIVPSITRLDLEDICNECPHPSNFYFR